MNLLEDGRISFRLPARLCTPEAIRLARSRHLTAVSNRVSQIACRASVRAFHASLDIVDMVAATSTALSRQVAAETHRRGFSASTGTDAHEFQPRIKVRLVASKVDKCLRQAQTLARDADVGNSYSRVPLAYAAVGEDWLFRWRARHLQERGLPKAHGWDTVHPELYAGKFASAGLEPPTSGVGLYVPFDAECAAQIVLAPPRTDVSAAAASKRTAGPRGGRSDRSTGRQSASAASSGRLADLGSHWDTQGAIPEGSEREQAVIVDEATLNIRAVVTRAGSGEDSASSSQSAAPPGVPGVSQLAREASIGTASPTATPQATPATASPASAGSSSTRGGSDGSEADAQTPATAPTAALPEASRGPSRGPRRPLRSDDLRPRGCNDDSALRTDSLPFLLSRGALVQCACCLVAHAQWCREAGLEPALGRPMDGRTKKWSPDGAKGSTYTKSATEKTEERLGDSPAAEGVVLGTARSLPFGSELVAAGGAIHGLVAASSRITGGGQDSIVAPTSEIVGGPSIEAIGGTRGGWAGPSHVRAFDSSWRAGGADTGTADGVVEIEQINSCSSDSSSRSGTDSSGSSGTGPPDGPSAGAGQSPMRQLQQPQARNPHSWRRFGHHLRLLRNNGMSSLVLGMRDCSSRAEAPRSDAACSGTARASSTQTGGLRLGPGAPLGQSFAFTRPPLRGKVAPGVSLSGGERNGGGKGLVCPPAVLRLLRADAKAAKWSGGASSARTFSDGSSSIARRPSPLPLVGAAASPFYGGPAAAGRVQAGAASRMHARIWDDSAYAMCVKAGVCAAFDVVEQPGKGRCVVAAAPIPSGGFFAEYGGQLIDGAEAARRAEAYRIRGFGSYMFEFRHGGGHHCIDATAERAEYGPARLLSHSRHSPNLVPRKVVVMGVPRLAMVALRDILRGEELSYDYGETSPAILAAFPWLRDS